MVTVIIVIVKSSSSSFIIVIAKIIIIIIIIIIVITIRWSTELDKWSRKEDVSTNPSNTATFVKLEHHGK